MYVILLITRDVANCGRLSETPLCYSREWAQRVCVWAIPFSRAILRNAGCTCGSM
jgi:hypothetical protein